MRIETPGILVTQGFFDELLVPGKVVPPLGMQLQVLFVAVACEEVFLVTARHQQRREHTLHVHRNILVIALLSLQALDLSDSCSGRSVAKNSWMGAAAGFELVLFLDTTSDV